MQATPFSFSGGHFARFEHNTNFKGLNKEGSFVKHQVVNRLRHLALVPGSAITGALDLVAGTALGVASVVTLGKVKVLNDHTGAHLKASCNILAKPFLHLLRTVNPRAEVNVDCDGFISSKLKLENLYLFAASSAKSENVFKKHVLSRLTFTLATVAMAISRVADAILALPLALVAFATAGKVRQINTIAYQCLQAPAIVRDLIVGLIFITNPQAVN